MKMNFVLDVDGVMTTGQFLYSSEGKAYKIFGPHDADGLKMIRDKVTISFVTADKKGFAISKKRIEEMGYPITLVSEEERKGFFEKNFSFDNLIYMGDGLHDVPIIQKAKFGIAPANARREAKEAANFVTESRAGEGAVCDACIEIKKRFLGG